MNEQEFGIANENLFIYSSIQKVRVLLCVIFAPGKKAKL